MYRTKRRQKNIKQKTRWFGHCAENIIKILYKVDNRTHSGSRFSVRGTIYVWSAALRNWSRLLLLFFLFFVYSFVSIGVNDIIMWMMLGRKCAVHLIVGRGPIFEPKILCRCLWISSFQLQRSNASFGQCDKRIWGAIGHEGVHSYHHFLDRVIIKLL